MIDLVVRSRRILVGATPEPAALHISKGRITTLAPFDAPVPSGARLIEEEQGVILPGLVDSHVHVNEPGRTDWEGFETATRAAAAGGITTLVDMPLNSDPVTTTPAALLAKRASARGKVWIDVGFWGGVVPGNEALLEPLLDDGLLGFKCFLVHSGIDDFPQVLESDLRRAMPILARRGAVLLVHAELPGPIEAAALELAREDAPARRYQTFLRSRPKAAENEAVALMIRLCRETHARVHIVHLSSAEAIAALAAAQREGLPISAETCPHYLAFEAEEVPEGATFFKCCPPIRERENRERLWDGLRAGTIGLVVSDHSPCPPEMKCLGAGDFVAAWGGIAALQFSLSLVWTEARRRGFDLAHIARWMSQEPARLAGLAERKGRLAPGADADFIVFDPEAPTTPEPQHIEHRHKLSPACGRPLLGVVRRSYLRGVAIYDEGRFTASPRGELIRLR